MTELAVPRTDGTTSKAPAGPPAPPGPARRPVVRRRPGAVSRRDVGTLLGCAASSFALVFLVFAVLLPVVGALGFVLCWYAAFLATLWLVVRETEGRLAAADRVAGTVVATGAALLVLPLVLIIGYVLVRGSRHFTLTFFTETLAAVGPLDPAESGGAAHAIVGTLQQVGLAVLLSVPLGMATAVFLTEVRGPLVRPVRTFVDAMSGVPSIVAGLFIYVVWVQGLGFGFSGVAATLALTILMLPTITRTSEEVLRLVPQGLREASLALGGSEWRTTWQVVLPTARSGLVTAAVLGVARAVGETAPLIMTSFGSSVLNANPLSQPQDSLPLFIFRQVASPQDAVIDRAWTGAMVLIALVLLLFTLARVVSRSTRRSR